MSITVKNTGDVAGSDVVLLYVESPIPGVGGAPIKSLAGFERVFLLPGESIAVPFPINAAHLALADEAGVRVAMAGTWALRVGQPTGLTGPVLVD